MQLPRTLEPVKQLVAQIIDDEVPERAAGLAYRFLFAVFPFAIFIAALAAFVAQGVGLGDPTEQILGAIGDNLPPDVAGQLAPQLRAVLGEARPGLLSIGAIAALWAATGGISSLIGAMNKAYDVDETRNFFVKTGIALALTAVGSIGILIAFVTIVGGSVLTEQAVRTLGVGPDAWGAISLLRFPLVLALVAAAVAVLFRFGPNVAVSFRWTFIGGLVFAVGWLLATIVFGLYVTNLGSYANTYGALGGVVVLMLWFYITALLLLCAAELTSLLAKLHEPEKVDARRVETRAETTTDGDKGADEGATDEGATDQQATDRSTPGGRTPVGRTTGAAPGVSATGKRRASRVFAAIVLVAGAVAGALAGRVAGDDEDATGT
ncbi:MAG: YihY/virulence factor BrkB family protein [Candidatus Limnocylindrales bacterium]